MFPRAMLAVLALIFAEPGFTQATAPIPVQPLTSVSAPHPGLAVWGDSMAADTWARAVAQNLGFDFFNDAVGGSKSFEALERKRADTTHRNWVTIYWTGHNNPKPPEAVIADIKAMVALQVAPRRFLVILPVQVSQHPVGSAGYRNIMLLAAETMKAFPNNFFDLRNHLAKAARDTEEDRRDVANGHTPTSLRADAIHLNVDGNKVVAKAVTEEIRRRGWDR